MQSLELKVPPLLLWAVLVAAAIALAEWIPAANWPFAGHRAVGILAGVCGAALAVAGVYRFRAERTTVNPLAPGSSTSIVTSGVYGFTRNPMYLGMATALLGVVVWCASLPALLLVPAFCAYLARFQIEPEERALLQAFGPEFARYRARVRRWV